MSESPGSSRGTPSSRRGRASSGGGLYYGWVVVGVIFLSSVASAAQVNPTIGVFVKPMSAEFGWSRSEMAGAVTLGTIVGGLLAVAIGPLIDRFGARWALFTGFLVTGGALLALGQIDRLWQFYAVTITTRLVLQGVLNLANQTVLAKWFVERRGRAMAFASLGQRIGSGAMPYLAQAVMDSHGWRSAAGGLGAAVWAMTLAPVLLWLRRQPEDMGLLPDGRTLAAAPAPGSSPRSGEPAVEVSYTLGEALRTRTFYLLLVAFCLTSFVTTGVNFNLVAYLTDQGLSGSQAVTVVLVWSLVAVPAALAAGLLAERFRGRWLMVVSHLGLAVGVVALARVEGVGTGLVFAVLHGGFFAAVMLVQPLVLANYYGARSIGAIRGFFLPWQMLSNALGPLAGAMVFDATSSYQPALVSFVAIMAGLSVALAMAGPPGGAGGASSGQPPASPETPAQGGGL